MLNEVYITKASKFLPNNPVENDDMEAYLGFINEQPSKSRRIVLRNNGIKRRFYAIDKNGIPTHSNSQMVSLAIRGLFKNADELKNIDLLSCGTSSPDQMMPSHAVMVHGWLPESGNTEVVSFSGVCCSGMHALKHAWMSVKLGEAKNAVATGSERLSKILRSEVFEGEAEKLAQMDVNPYIAFDKDFLRWMLSDGAAAFLISSKKNENDINLKIEWIESSSNAHKIETCMYMASDKLPDGSLKSYMDYTPEHLLADSVLSIKQDVRLLNENIVPLGVDMYKAVLKKHNLSPKDIDHFLPHLSSEFFRKKIAEMINAAGVGIAPEKWFTNLSTVGNVGAGSIYLMIEELFNSGKLKKGEKILLMVPESARFSYVYALLTVC